MTDYRQTEYLTYLGYIDRPMATDVKVICKQTGVFHFKMLLKVACRKATLSLKSKIESLNIK